MKECNIYCIAAGMDVTFDLNMINAYELSCQVQRTHCTRGKLQQITFSVQSCPNSWVGN